MTTFLERLYHVQVGDKVHLFSEKNPYKVMARSDRYIIFSKPCFGKSLYTIMDFEEQWMGPDDRIFSCYDYRDLKECEEAIKALENKEMGVSQRRGISFDCYAERHLKGAKNTSEAK